MAVSLKASFICHLMSILALALVYVVQFPSMDVHGKNRTLEEHLQYFVPHKYKYKMNSAVFYFDFKTDVSCVKCVMSGPCHWPGPVS